MNNVVSTKVSPVESLIQWLQRINAGEVKVVVRNGIIVCDPTILSLAEDALVCVGGCNWDGIDMVRKAGFKVYPREKDSSGSINTAKGTIIYG